MKPRNKTVEMEMRGTRGLPSVSFIKQALPVIDRFIWWQESWLALIDLYIDIKNLVIVFQTGFSVESKWERK